MIFEDGFQTAIKEIKSWIEDNVVVESQKQEDGSTIPIRVIRMDDIEEFLEELLKT